MEFTLKTRFKASPQVVYQTWLNSVGHTNMTGSDAEITDKVGDSFSAWDRYIEGSNIELEPHKRILQSWRTSEFEDDEEDSIIEIILDDVNGETELTLIHTKLSGSGEQYKDGWKNHYFVPMKEYFLK